MSMKRFAGLLGASLLAVTLTTALPQGANAESGLLWLDSAYAWPATPAGYAHRWQRVHRYVALPRRPAIVRVAAVTAPRADCFWCNVRISGLSF
jgi:hypothetical protein